MMKLYLSFLFFLVLLSTKADGQRCLSDTMHTVISKPTKELETRNPLLQLPVVVHLVLPQSVIIEDQQVYNQINALNRDFRRHNSNLNTLPLTLQALAADTKIEFCLANIDPDGIPGIGITRTTTSIENIGIYNSLFSANDGGKSPWPSHQYLNIWVCEMPEDILGYASSPKEAGDATDGVVINYRYFGTLGAHAPFQMGRTLVHELGHYFGLAHPWGTFHDECEEDDGISDTFPQSGPHNECPPREYKMCDDANPSYSNYMDYTPDCCLAMFTKQQAAIMRQNIYEYRAQLLQNPAICHELQDDIPISLYPNPATSLCVISWPEEEKIEHIEFYDFAGKKISQTSLHQQSSQIEICLDPFPKGLLLLRLVTDDNKYYIHRLYHH